LLDLARPDDIDIRLLDAGLNGLQFWSLAELRNRSAETVGFVMGIPVEQAKEKWDAVVADKAFYESNSRIEVRREVEAEVRRKVIEYLKSISITVESVETLLAQSGGLKRVAKLLGSSQIRLFSEQLQVSQITFSDYSWNDEDVGTCDDLVKAGLMFRSSWNSKKHSYREYVFRSWPFNAAVLLRTGVLRSLRIDRLSTDEWHTLSILLLAGNQSVSLQSLEQNSGLPAVHLRESLSRLDEQGIIRRQGNTTQVAQGLLESLCAFWASNIYPVTRESSFRRFQHSVGKAVANLEPFFVAKKLLESQDGKLDDTPIRAKRVPLSLVPNVDDLSDLCKLGLAFRYQSELVLPGDLIRQIEDWLRSSINSRITFIPANDFAFAREMLRTIFSKCEDYVKIQDAFIGSDTIDLLAYVPEGVAVHILTAIKPAGDEDPVEVYAKLQKIESRRKGGVLIQFIGNANGAAPFHDRLIITKSGCWQTGTSLKDIGRGKDTTITDILLSQQKETLEPAFERWWSMKKTDLESRGLERLSLDTWRKRATQ